MESNYIEILRKNDLLREISDPVDINLEIAHISYIEVKKPDSKALLFTNVTDKNGKKYPPVLTNIFGSKRAVEIILKAHPDAIADEISALLKPKKPKNFMEKIDFMSYLFGLRNVFTKRLKERGECQDVAYFDDAVNLNDLPALKTWELDGGAFITMGQVYTQSLDGELQNLGMYRLQVYDKNRLGMHWQIHKDGANFFNEYKHAGCKMPVSVAIGGDPLYIWCGQAPLPKGIFELLLYGFIRKSPARLVKSLTNEIYVPHDADFVIEGFVDTDKFELEGPFGDHTGFYTPIEPFPVMDVTAITHKKEPVFHATVVGKPPLEDKYMGWATERIFLPLLRTTVPELIDYNMPENGVFHNLILAKLNAIYPGHAKQAMHAFWGVGQMSFVKHAIFVDQNAPGLGDYEAISDLVLNRFGEKSILISEGVCDQLDHASPNSCYGGKLGIDATVDCSDNAPVLLSDKELLDKFQSVSKKILELKQYKTNTKNPICVIKFGKNENVSSIFEKLLKFKENFRILIFVGVENRIENAYMLLWRVVNNIDAMRDIYIKDGVFCVDATSKNELEGYTREWPKQTDCTKDIVYDLIKRGVIKDEPELFEKFEIFG
ncbi:menaquinone biosynthesis decarboxylase [Campylobacter sp. RM9344]|uniref:Menaquinone biosynthesis decarboxylase n=1 Tax=Campylobacter californiensis TaxID=1032243 RepID=A0AAW3ZTE8_9BACT|nr:MULTISPECIES: menaquinone biosynthesis decarboxylase [unclassified Campylobacter]MBE2983773.1 menaquinone biosynthesis decarboxylase [Campylobacter sp. RM6883]MBE2994311.1 menaquinone biosynthesis decarboxylase [Campylobacter sp. RM6913]MBE3028619.1 menaquinone biosynthesis decarboxylase [Campylobacter sp. RM9344]MBE3607508.1 menaquinone biosynthesis decarboxylase [Campylobacter sp. RM9337]QCD50902.1 1,4-dihydroxy-2-naphthoate octaprenyltransferase [Campylobacter sp. RM6914]